MSGTAIPTPAHGAVEAAERRLFATIGLEARTRFITLPDFCVPDGAARAKGAMRPMRVRVLEAGEGDPALLLHGGGGFAALWAPLMAQAPGVRWIAVDRPGCGLSDGFDYGGVAFREHAVGFIGATMDALGLERVPIVANSMGGLWAFWFALAHPERVASLGLLGCPAGIPLANAPLPFRLLGVPGINRLLFALEPPSVAQVRRTWARMGHDPDRMLPELTECFYRVERLPTYATGWRTLLERFVTLRGMRPDVLVSEAELRRVAQRVLLVWGESDPFGGLSAAETLRDALPCAALELAGRGHLPWLDDPARCGELVRRVLDSPAAARVASAA
ncbi:MAG TPA: alpha/beta hydrolase [Chloroflexota bacterium]|nr:alpha/beta hydrolase [Chloroflexota bacterium]